MIANSGDNAVIMLHECRLLSARITVRQCRANRQRGLVSCSICKGLPDEIAEVVKVKEEQIPMAHPRCIVDGCDKQRANGKFCRAHSRQYKTEEAYYASLKAQPVGDDKPAQGSPQPLPTTSLLSLVPVAPAPAPTEARPGFFLDFTGHEELLKELQDEIGEDLPGDIINLLQMLHDGKLMRAA